jgi:hypothetical protein
MTSPRADEPTAAAELSAGADRRFAFARRGYDRWSHISEADCLIRLDNFRGGRVPRLRESCMRENRTCSLSGGRRLVPVAADLLRPNSEEPRRESRDRRPRVPGLVGAERRRPWCEGRPQGGSEGMRTGLSRAEGAR